MEKNVCIVHYNTPVLTEHLVRSINKHTPGTNIFIFDNSDKKPFKNSFENVTVFDNTKGQIINFDQWLKKYPNRDKSGGKANNWGSAKHAYSVEKCMELIKKPFVLFDSDVIVKKDFTELFDEIVCYKGEVIVQSSSNIKRVLPFICFINTTMCKEKGIHYFDENYMHGLKYKGNSDSYDTGAALYILTEKKKAPHREIKFSDYVVHYGNGSWTDAAEKMRSRPKHMPVNEWLEKFKQFWADEPIKKVANDVNFSKLFNHIYCLHYLPASDRLPKLKEELKRVGIDVNAKYFSWVYDYPTPLLDTVYADKRVKMNVALKASSRDYIKRVSIKHYEIIKEAYSLGYERILIMEDDVRFHRDSEYIQKMLKNIPDSDVIMFDKMTCSASNEAIKYKNYVKTLPENSLYGSMNDSGVFFIFSSCYSVNRKAMKRIMELYENGLLPPDTPLNDKQLTGSFAIVNLAIQDPKFKTKKDETYDKIGLDVSLYDREIEPLQKPAENTAVKPKQASAPGLEKKSKTPQTGSAKKSQVIFKIPTKPLIKERIEPVSSVKSSSLKPTLPDKRKTTQTRILKGKMAGFNKLYDM